MSSSFEYYPLRLDQNIGCDPDEIFESDNKRTEFITCLDHPYSKTLTEYEENFDNRRAEIPKSFDTERYFSLELLAPNRTYYDQTREEYESFLKSTDKSEFFDLSIDTDSSIDQIMDENSTFYQSMNEDAFVYPSMNEDFYPQTNEYFYQQNDDEDLPIYACVSQEIFAFEDNDDSMLSSQYQDLESIKHNIKKDICRFNGCESESKDRLQNSIKARNLTLYG
ncbi:hypothetical protein MHBO_002301 [Bonamia ostreae]|uniref:Uncharacterized protein n=1 Tax=Bonamia ostreae TaxID=126728 RepID=A0ABV2ALW6_9EUKA